MKLTKQLLVTLVEKVLKESNERPWYHGPWESDWDREQKAAECEEGNQAVCDELEKDEEEWTRFLIKIIGEDEAFIEESNMKPILHIKDVLTIQHYLDNIGRAYGTAYDKQLRNRSILVQAAKVTAREGLPFPEDRLKYFLQDITGPKTSEALYNAARNAYIKAGGQLR